MAELIPGVSNPLMNLTKTQKSPFWNEISAEKYIGQRPRGSKSAENGSVSWVTRGHFGDTKAESFKQQLGSIRVRWHKARLGCAASQAVSGFAASCLDHRQLIPELTHLQLQQCKNLLSQFLVMLLRCKFSTQTTSLLHWTQLCSPTGRSVGRRSGEELGLASSWANRSTGKCWWERQRSTWCGLLRLLLLPLYTCSGDGQSQQP